MHRKNGSHGCTLVLAAASACQQHCEQALHGSQKGCKTPKALTMYVAQNYPLDRDDEESYVLRIMYARPQLKPNPGERGDRRPGSLFSPREVGGRGRGRFSDRPGRGRGDADGEVRGRGGLRDDPEGQCPCCSISLFRVHEGLCKTVRKENAEAQLVAWCTSVLSKHQQTACQKTQACCDVLFYKQQVYGLCGSMMVCSDLGPPGHWPLCSACSREQGHSIIAWRASSAADGKSSLALSPASCILYEMNLHPSELVTGTLCKLLLDCS